MSESCDYGNLREDLIRDRIVIGVYSDALSDSLQAKSDLSLKKPIELSGQAEAFQHNRECALKLFLLPDHVPTHASGLDAADTIAGSALRDTVVSDQKTWLQSENLLTTKQTLRGPGGTLLPVMGVIKARLRH